MESQFKKGVSLLRRYDDNISYKCDCACGDNEHEVVLDFDLDEDFGLITLNFYKIISFSHYWIYRNILWFDKFKENVKRKTEEKSNLKIIFYYIMYWLENTIIYYSKCFWCRLKAATRILFTGYIKMESDFLINDGEQIDNFILALQEGRDILKQKNKVE